MRTWQSGTSLIDTLVGVFLLLVVFLGIAAAIQFALSVVSNDKARAGAIALANERMEYLRSLSYTSLGTAGGVPSGTVPQSEAVSLNGTNYTRRTTIQYVDDPKDGTGAADTNGITADYKQARVDVAWQSSQGPARHVVLVSRFSPPGIETTVPGGTLVVNAVNASGAPLPGVQIQIQNSAVSPAVNVTTYANDAGQATLIGTPAGSGYQVMVSSSGYSTAQTYSSTAQNTSPSPANLTVSNNTTTSGTFAIDVLGNKTIRTWNGTSALASTTALANVTFTMTGAKTIGTGPSGTLYKYSQSLSSGASGTLTVPNLEWDSYTIAVGGSYDIASACNPQPESLAPGASMTTDLYLAPHTTNSLLVDVHAASNGTLVSGATVMLTRTGFLAATSTDRCGQSFFSNLTAASTYTVAVGQAGHATTTISNVNVSGTKRLSATLN